MAKAAEILLLLVPVSLSFFLTILSFMSVGSRASWHPPLQTDWLDGRCFVCAAHWGPNCYIRWVRSMSGYGTLLYKMRGFFLVLNETTRGIIDVRMQYTEIVWLMFYTRSRRIKYLAVHVNVVHAKERLILTQQVMNAMCAVPHSLLIKIAAKPSQ